MTTNHALRRWPGLAMLLLVIVGGARTAVAPSVTQSPAFRSGQHPPRTAVSAAVEEASAPEPTAADASTTLPQPAPRALAAETLAGGQPVPTAVSLPPPTAAAVAELAAPPAMVLEPPVPTAPPTAPAAGLAPLALDAGPALAGMPQTVVVARTLRRDCAPPAADTPTQRMAFVDYLRNVLPNEWRAQWPEAALDSGAIAVKQYAWYTVVIQRKWRSQGYAFDLVDNACDQIYQDVSADPRTDAAFQRTWGTVLTRDGGLLPIVYRDTDASCGGTPDCFGQVESAELAGAGASSLQILARYYRQPGVAVSSTGQRLPAQLPPVPPAPRLPAPTAPPTATPTPLPPTASDSPTPTVPSGPETAPAAAPPAEPAVPTAQPATPTPSPAMPDLLGMGENQAKELLRRLGVSFVVVDYQGRDRIGDLVDRVPPYAVLSQTPPPGTPVSPDTIVVLGVRAPE